MKKKTRKHFMYYSLLLCLLVAFVMLSAFTNYNRQLQIELVMLTTFGYVVWGVFHHVIEHDITAKIMIEYVLVGSLGIVVSLILIQGI